MIRTLLLATLILLSAAGSGSGQIKPAGKLPAEPREELRYRGKPFTYWQNSLRTELNAEMRIDTLHAMAAFGARGYAWEATAVVVELLKDYDNDKDAFDIDSSAPEKGSPDQRIIHEARWALRKIGPEISTVLLAHLDHKGVRRVATELFTAYIGKYCPMAITVSSVPLLVRGMQSKDDEMRDLAIHIFGKAIDQRGVGEKIGKDFQTRFLQIVAKEKKEKVIVDALTQGLTGEIPVAEAGALLLGNLGLRAKSAVPALVRMESWDNGVGWAARDALAKIKPTPAERIPGLLLEFTSGDYRIAEAATKLGEIGSEAKIAVADLLTEIKKPLRKYVSEKDFAHERFVIATAIVKIAGPKETLPLIVELLEKGGSGIDGDLVKLYLGIRKPGAD